MSGKCYICDREELNQLIPCDLCQKDITLYNSFFCDVGLKNPHHNIVFCRQCGIVDETSLVYYCSEICQFKDLIQEEFNEYQRKYPDRSVKNSLKTN